MRTLILAIGSCLLLAGLASAESATYLLETPGVV